MLNGFRNCIAARILVGVFGAACLGGCAHYTTPSRGADMTTFGVAAARNANDAGIQQALDKRPLANFPTGIAVVRVQSPGYQSNTAQGWGQGNYSIVTTRDIEEPMQIERLGKLPQISGMATVNRLLLPRELRSDVELRQAAAQLHADMLLVYTVDTIFTDNDMAEPLTLVTLGLAPNQHLRVVTTASAALLDTRNGYVYGVSEATESRNALSMAWGSSAAMDSLRCKTETAAFEKLVGEMEKMWSGVVKQYAPGDKARASAF